MRSGNLLAAAGVCVALVLASAVTARAGEACPHCRIGIWNDIHRTQCFGDMQPGTPKEIFVGLETFGAFDGYTGVEFSISGLQPFFVVVEFPGVLPAIVLGDVKAPALPGRSGGLSLVWDSCQPIPGVFMKLTLIPPGVPPQNQAFTVMQKFPPSNPLVPEPLFWQCDDPQFTIVSVTGGCYILNWDGFSRVDGCFPSIDTVEAQEWSVVKALYR